MKLGLEHFYTSHSNYNDNYINKNELCSSQFLNATASLKHLGVNGDLNPDVHDVDAVLHDLIYQGNWELVVMWVDDKAVDDG